MATTNKYKLIAKLTKTHLELTISGGGSNKAAELKNSGIVIDGSNSETTIEELFGKSVPPCITDSGKVTWSGTYKYRRTTKGKKPYKLTLKPTAKPAYNYDGNPLTLKIKTLLSLKSISNYSFQLPDNTSKTFHTISRASKKPTIELTADRKSVVKEGTKVFLNWKITGNDNVSKAILSGTDFVENYLLTKGAKDVNKSWDNTKNKGLEVYIKSDSTFDLSVTTKDTGETIKNSVTISLTELYLRVTPPICLPYSPSVKIEYGGGEPTKTKEISTTSKGQIPADELSDSAAKGYFFYKCLANTTQEFELKELDSGALKYSKAKIKPWNKIKKNLKLITYDKDQNPLKKYDTILDAVALYNEPTNVIGLIAKKDKSSSLFVYKINNAPIIVENESPTTWTSIQTIPGNTLKGFTAFGFNNNSLSFQLFAFDINGKAITDKKSYTPPGNFKVMGGDKLNIIIQDNGYLIWVKDKWNLKISFGSQGEWVFKDNQSEALKTNLMSWPGEYGKDVKNEIANHRFYDPTNKKTVYRSILISHIQKGHFSLNHIRAIPFGNAMFYNIGTPLPTTLPAAEKSDANLDLQNAQPLSIGPILLMSGCGSQVKSTSKYCKNDIRPQELFLNTLDKNHKWEHVGLTYPLPDDFNPQKVTPLSFDYWKMMALCPYDISKRKYDLYLYALQKQSSSNSFSISKIKYTDGPKIIQQGFNPNQVSGIPENGLGRKSNYKITYPRNTDIIQLKIELLSQINPVSELQTGFAFYVPNDRQLWAPDLEQKITVGPSWKVEVNDSPLDPYSLQKEILVYYIGDITNQTANDLMPLTITLPTEKKVNLMDIDCVVPDYFVEKLPLSFKENSSFYLKIHDDKSKKVDKAGASAILNWNVPNGYSNAQLTGIFDGKQSVWPLNKSAVDISKKYFNDDATKLSVNVYGTQPYTLSAWDSNGNYYSKTLNLDVEEDGKLCALMTNTLTPAPGNGLFFFKDYGQKKVSFYRNANGQTVEIPTANIHSRNGYLKGCVQLPLLNSGKQETYQLWAGGRVTSANISITVPSSKLHYVNIKASGKEDGSSWDDAFTDLQAAIDKAQEGDALLVAGGTYKPTQLISKYIKNYGGSENKTKSFYINKNIKLYGGWEGVTSAPYKRDSISYPTILSGKIGAFADNRDGADHVVFIDGTSALGNISNECIIDGFTITEGYSDGDDNDWDAQGGGILNYAGIAGKVCSPIITNCIFKNNQSEEKGAGICNYAINGESSPIISYCTFYNNGSGNGSAIANLTSIEEDTLNKASKCNSTIINCTFFRDDSTATTSLVHFGEGCKAYVKNCIFWGDGLILSKGKNTPFQGYISHSIIKGYDGKGKMDGISIGQNCINADPLFLNEKLKDFHVFPDSPAKGAGTSGSDIGVYKVPVGNRIYVTEDGTGTGIGNKRWENATTLQKALDQAKEGDYITIAKGSYKPVKAVTANIDQSKTFYVNKNIKIYGGFGDKKSGFDIRDIDRNQTILSGKIGSKYDNSDGAYHVMLIDGTTPEGNISNECVVDGLTIIEGYANDKREDWGCYGGGILNYADVSGKTCNPIISHCIIKNNKSSLNGAGIANYGKNGNASPKILFCSFFNNLAYTGSGGGIIYVGNKNVKSNAAIINCSFSNNLAIHGGAICCNTNGNTIIQDCIIWDNGKSEIAAFNSPITISHTIIKGCETNGYYGQYNLSDGGNNLDSDPLFLSKNIGVFYLLPKSPALKKGMYGGNMGANPCLVDINTIKVFGNATGTDAAKTNLKEFQDAIKKAEEHDIILVANGQYMMERYKVLGISKNIKVFGGFTKNFSARSPLQSKSVIERKTSGSDEVDFTIQSTNRECIVDGFTLSDCRVVNTTNGLLESNPTISNCYFTSEYRMGSDTGFLNYTHDSSGLTSPLFSYCVFDYKSIDVGGYKENFEPCISFCTFIKGGINLGRNTVQISDSIFWESKINPEYTSTRPIKNCIIQGCSSPSFWKAWLVDGGRNIDEDPLFAAPDKSNFNPVIGSSALGKAYSGNNIGALPTRPQTTYYVNCYRTAGKGTSPDEAFEDIQSAIDLVVNGDIIKVAKGTYKTNVLEIKRGIQLLGGYASDFDPKTRLLLKSPTILDGQQKGHVIKLTDVYPPNGMTCKIEGFVIQNAQNEGNFGYSGGILIGNQFGKIIISHCWFRRNNNPKGAPKNMAILMEALQDEVPSPEISHCVFEEQSIVIKASPDTPGIKNVTINHCTIVNKSETAVEVFGKVTVDLTNSIILGNPPIQTFVNEGKTKVGNFTINNCLLVKEGGGQIEAKTKRGANNIYDQNPKMQVSGAKLYNLDSDSPCIGKAEGGGDIGALPSIIKKIWYVKPGGKGDGSSWGKAISLQSAIEQANGDDQIFVAKGTYFPTSSTKINGDNTSNTFYINKNIQLFGGFAGTESKPEERKIWSNPTVLSGKLKDKKYYHTIVHIDGTSPYGEITDECILDGFIISGSGSEPGSSSLGTMVIDASKNASSCSPTIKNCLFKDNKSNAGNGVISIRSITGSSAYPSISFSTFYNNAGFESLIKLDCINGTGSPDVNISNCTFLDNIGLYRMITGGAAGVATIINSIFWGKSTFAFKFAIGSSSISYSIIKGCSGQYFYHQAMIQDGGSNKNVDPKLVDPAKGNFYLQASSPACIGGEDNNFMGAFPVDPNL